MLVEFNRTSAMRQNEDGIHVPYRLAINPEQVGAVLESISEPGEVIIRLVDGRGFSVAESYESVCEKLSATKNNIKASKPKSSQKQLAAPKTIQGVDGRVDGPETPVLNIQS